MFSLLVFSSFSQLCFTKTFLLSLFNISISFTWQPLLKHWTMVHSPLAYTALLIVTLLQPTHLKHFLYSSLSYKALWFLCLYLPTGLRKRMLETDCAFVSVTETCLTQFQKGTSTSPSFGASQSFHLLRDSFSKSILLTCLFKINTAYYSFCNCVSLSLSPS